MDQKLIVASIAAANLHQVHNLLSQNFLLPQKKILKRIQWLLHRERIDRLTMIYSCRFFLRTPRRMWMKNRRRGWFVHLLVHRDEEDFFESFRMKKETFRYICDMLRERLQPKPNPLSSRPSVSTEEKVAIGIYYLACTGELRVIGEVFGLAKATIWKHVNDVCQAVVDILLPIWIKMPNEEECETLSLEFQIRTGLSQIIGAINGSHIPIAAPAEGLSDFTNRKGWQSLNLQAFVDSNCL